MSASSEILNNAQNVGQDGLGLSKQALGFGAAGLSAGFSLFKCIHQVPEGHVGVRTRLGRGRNRSGELVGLKKKPGWAVTAPFVESMIYVSITDTFQPLEDMWVDVMSENDNEDERRQILLKSTVNFAVDFPDRKDDDFKNKSEQLKWNPYNSLFKLNSGVDKVKNKNKDEIEDELLQGVKEVCTDGLRRALLGHKVPESDGDHIELFSRFNKKIEARIGKYGLKALDLYIATASNTLGQYIKESSGTIITRAAVAAKTEAEEIDGTSQIDRQGFGEVARLPISDLGAEKTGT